MGRSVEQSDVFWNSLVPEMTVTSVAASLLFYGRLGFAVRYQRTNPAFAYLTLGHAQLMIEEYHETGWNVAPLERPYGRGVNLQIEVPDVSTLAQTLHTDGIPFFRPLAEVWYRTTDDVHEGVREFLVQDPDGYLLRFAQNIGQKPAR